MYNLGYTWVLSNMVRVVGLKPTSLAVPNRAFYQLNYTRIFHFYKSIFLIIHIFCHLSNVQKFYDDFFPLMEYNTCILSL